MQQHQIMIYIEIREEEKMRQLPIKKDQVELTEEDMAKVIGGTSPKLVETNLGSNENFLGAISDNLPFEKRALHEMPKINPDEKYVLKKKKQ